MVFLRSEFDLHAKYLVRSDEPLTPNPSDFLVPSAVTLRRRVRNGRIDLRPVWAFVRVIFLQTKNVDTLADSRVLGSPLENRERRERGRGRPHGVYRRQSVGSGRRRWRCFRRRPLVSSARRRCSCCSQPRCRPPAPGAQPAKYRVCVEGVPVPGGGGIEGANWFTHG